MERLKQSMTAHIWNLACKAEIHIQNYTKRDVDGELLEFHG